MFLSISTGLWFWLLYRIPAALLTRDGLLRHIKNKIYKKYGNAMYIYFLMSSMYIINDHYDINDWQFVKALGVLL